jgi:tRNA (mo5U34)-methyltransferase
MNFSELEKIDRQELIKLVDECDWYHVLELGDGIVTDGFFDIRSQLYKYCIPEDLTGKRILDIGRASGFFSFEFERRGGDVTATDLPSSLEKEFVGGELTREVWKRWILERHVPSDMGSDQLGSRMDFFLARAILKSNVKPICLKLNDLSPERFDGQKFDIVFVGSVLNHVKDPAGALEKIFATTSDLCILANPYDPDDNSNIPRMRLIGRSAPSLTTWWMPNLACLKELLYCVGFEEINVVSSDVVLRGRHKDIAVPHAVLHARRPRSMETAISRWAELCTEALPPVWSNSRYRVSKHD